MRGIVILSKFPNDAGETVTAMLIQSRKLDDLLKKARHVGYQNGAEFVDVYKLGDRAKRRKYIRFARRFDANVGKVKLIPTIIVNRVMKDELPRIEKWIEPGTGTGTGAGQETGS